MREYRPRFVKAAPDLVGRFEGCLLQTGVATLLEGSNAIIVKDSPEGVERADRLMEALDTRPPQVLIEARLVEMSTAYSKMLGVDWLAGYRHASADVFGSLGSVETSFGVNLPSGVEEGMSIGFGLVTDRLTLDARLSALEEEGEARLFSSPSVVVLENRKATITSGTDILVPSVEATTVVRTGPETRGVTQEVKSEIFAARLELTVTPRTIGGGQMLLSIDTRREEFDFSREVQGFPPRSTWGARTDLLVADGETVVIGGIYTENEENEERRVPFLHKIPLLG